MALAGCNECSEFMDTSGRPVGYWPICMGLVVVGGGPKPIKDITLFVLIFFVFHSFNYNENWRVKFCKFTISTMNSKRKRTNENYVNPKWKKSSRCDRLWRVIFQKRKYATALKRTSVGVQCKRRLRHWGLFGFFFCRLPTGDECRCRRCCCRRRRRRHCGRISEADVFNKCWTKEHNGGRTNGPTNNEVWVRVHLNEL